MAQITTPSAIEDFTDPTQRRFRGSAKMAEYQIMKEKLGEGTFGIVSKAKSRRTGQVVALKKILMHNEKDGFPITALREIKLLKMLSHPNILRLEEMAVERQAAEDKKNGQKRATLYMVTPYMDHDLSGMLTNPDIVFIEPQIKCYMQQLLEGLRYLHDSHILHRDMKAANILISNRGLLQIADFGLARHYEGVPPQSRGGNGEAVREYTSLVVTRWYRPPELLLTLRRYTPAIDIWGVGCVFGEMFERKPILEGKTDIDQCARIFQLVGSPNDRSMPGWSDLPGCEGTNQWDHQDGDIDRRFGPKLGKIGLKLLKQMLCLDWRVRINAVDALQHEYFKTAPLPARPEDIPRYEDSHELDARRRGHEKERALPPAPKGGTVGMGPDDHNDSGAMNGYGYRGDRAPPRAYSRDRAPQGPPRSHDDRRAPPTAADARPAPRWKQERPQDFPPMNGNSHGLPPRPNEMPPRPDLGSRGHSQASQGSAGGGGVDTYIPSYSSANPNDRPPARDNHDRGRRENGYRDNDGPPYRERPYRDADAPSERRPPRHEEPYRDRGQYGGERRPRSRSPSYRRDDARRDRPPNRDRDRDYYRR